MQKDYDTHLFRAVMDFQNTHSLKDYKEKISAFEKFFCKKKLCQYIAIFNFV